MKRCVNEMHMAEVSICYGMTETSPVSCQTRTDDDLDRRTATIGRVHPHVEIKIVDPATGETVERGETGEFCTRGYSVMLGYWDDQEKTDEAIDADGWMHTGDLAEMREDGYCNIVGRIKDMVIRGGENIYPREIEEFLYTHPDIEDVQVIGVPDEQYGEELGAWIKLRGRRRAARRRRGPRVRHRQARALQDPALRAAGRRVPDDRDRQDPQGARCARSPPRARTLRSGTVTRAGMTLVGQVVLGLRTACQDVAPVVGDDEMSGVLPDRDHRPRDSGCPVVSILRLGCRPS